MRREMNPAVVAVVIVIVVGIAFAMLWRLSEHRKRPADYVPARALVRDPSYREKILQRHREKYGGAPAPTSNP